MKTTAPKAALFLPMLVLYFFQSLSAQNQVAGALRDAGGKPLGFASVLLLAAADSALLRGQICSEHGDFVFENVPAGRYVCSFSMLGFEPGFSQAFLLAETTGRLELEPVVLHESVALLNEALVVAKRPFLEQQVDRTVVNVANSITKAGGTALEVLQRSPGVQVNALTKSISLLGKEGVVVMINGKISRQPADAILQMLA
ncbi:MAG: carboxypeptidase regulatory-like domain-containing protein, partial [Saprospiraceae bacterium]|nr:carboxypeptidase regulatory-like domain-containing protein [Saprospiraceae bacterium]